MSKKVLAYHRSARYDEDFAVRFIDAVTRYVKSNEASYQNAHIEYAIKTGSGWSTNKSKLKAEDLIGYDQLIVLDPHVITRKTTEFNKFYYDLQKINPNMELVFILSPYLNCTVGEALSYSLALHNIFTSIGENNVK